MATDQTKAVKKSVITLSGEKFRIVEERNVEFYDTEGQLIQGVELICVPVKSHSETD